MIEERTEDGITWTFKFAADDVCAHGSRLFPEKKGNYYKGRAGCADGSDYRSHSALQYYCRIPGFPEQGNPDFRPAGVGRIPGAPGVLHGNQQCLLPECAKGKTDDSPVWNRVLQCGISGKSRCGRTLRLPGTAVRFNLSDPPEDRHVVGRCILLYGIAQPKGSYKKSAEPSLYHCGGDRNCPDGDSAAASGISGQEHPLFGGLYHGYYHDVHRDGPGGCRI